MKIMSAILACAMWTSGPASQRVEQACATGECFYAPIGGGGARGSAIYDEYQLFEDGLIDPCCPGWGPGWNQPQPAPIVPTPTIENGGCIEIPGRVYACAGEPQPGFLTSQTCYKPAVTTCSVEWIGCASEERSEVLGMRFCAPKLRRWLVERGAPVEAVKP